MITLKTTPYSGIIINDYSVALKKETLENNYKIFNYCILKISFFTCFFVPRTYRKGFKMHLFIFRRVLPGSVLHFPLLCWLRSFIF